MRYFILTSDRYSFLLEGFFELFDKHWKDFDGTMEILGFDEPNITLPEYASFLSLGKQSDFDRWDTPLIKFFQDMEDDQFFLCFEDHFLVGDVSNELMTEALSYLETDNIDKVYLLCDEDKIENHYKGNFHKAFDKPRALVNNSLLPSIWKKNFFMKLLLNNAPTSGKFESSNDLIKLDCRTLLTEKTALFPSLDAMRRGTFNTKQIFDQFKRTGNCITRDWQHWLKQLNKEDIDIFYKMYDKWKKEWRIA